MIKAQNDNPTRPASFDGFSARRRFDSLDGLRCFCILVVIWHHTPGAHAIDVNLLHRGFLGVDMFFVLSGFLITTLLIRERAKHGRISLRAFWIRRSLRIFPIYYLSLLLISIAYLLFRKGDPNASAFFSELPFHIFYLSNWQQEVSVNLDPLWSLGTEEQFYLFWPLVAAFAIKPARRVILVLLLVVNVLISTRTGASLFFEEGAAHPIFELSIMQTTFLPILLGVALAHVLHNERLHGLIAPFVAPRWASLAWVVILVALIQFAPSEIQGWPRIAMQLSMTAIVASTVIQPSHALTGFLNIGIFKRLGEISYGMYLFHLWTVDVLRRVLPKLGIDLEPWPVLMFVLIVIATVIAAEISFRLIEAPVLKFKKRFTRVAMGRDEQSDSPSAAT